MIIAFLMINLSGFAQQNHDDNNEQVKNYSKSYTADDNDKLQIDNRYGKVTVNTWNKNEFKVDVQIKVEAKDQSSAKKWLDNVTISDSKSGSAVSFQTNIGKQNSSWGSWFTGGNSYRKMEVNYTVYMPAKNALNINNKYGSIELPNLDGKVLINLSYGSLSAKSLTNADNEINVGYGSVNIENLSGNNLDVKYGNLTLGSADKLTANVSYSAVKIGKLTTFGNFSVKFSGGFQIADLGKNLKSLSVNSSYTNIRLGLSGDENADFNVTVTYGNFNYGSHTVNISNKTPGENKRGWRPTQNYTGYLGKGNNDKVINITSRYGSVKLD
jgi:hypothetical protein